MAHLGKENVANLQQCQEAANDVKVKITSDGLKRMPCERPRCVARRQAIGGFKRASSTAWLRLTPSRWKQYSGTTPMARGAACNSHECTKAKASQRVPAMARAFAFIRL